MADRTEAEALAIVREAVASGDPGALDRLFELFYDRLRAMAARHLRGERRGHSLQPTALVHEVWLRLARGGGEAPPADRARFLALAASAMRRALVDHARQRDRAKRGGQWLRVTFDPGAGPAAGGETREVDLLALDAALTRLGELDERLARVVELRAFAGMTLAETAAFLEVSVDTVHDDWVMARTWLWGRLKKG